MPYYAICMVSQVGYVKIHQKYPCEIKEVYALVSSFIINQSVMDIFCYITDEIIRMIMEFLYFINEIWKKKYPH
jgi:hypothetical protein